MWIHGLCDCLTGENKEAWKNGRITGTVVLMKKNVLDLNDYHASLLDKIYELLDQRVTFQLISSTHTDPSTGKGKLGNAAHLEEWVTTMSTVAAGESKFKIHFDWDESQGIPGAVIVVNKHHSEFYLKTLTLEGVPGKGKVHFVCNSWIYPKYHYDRIFFTNETYLPSKMPGPLVPYRQQELKNLRGDDVPGPLKESDRVYGYAVYNDLGDPDKDQEHVRPVLGGPEHPYPRRGRTSRHPTKTDPKSESRQSVLKSLDIYVPRDERFGHLKLSDFLAYALKSIGQALFPTLHSIFDLKHLTPKEFDSIEDTLNLYDGGIPLPDDTQPEMLEKLLKKIPFEFIKEWFRTDGAHLFRLPTPKVLKEDKFAWRTDEEFGREMLAGVNPVIIRRLRAFPPTSDLDPTVYGNQTSTIKEEHILKNLEGFTVLKALRENRLFIQDHHDAFMPNLPKINALEGNYIYATRTLLFLKDDGTLKPIAIELSLPHPDGLQDGAVSKVYTPASEGVEGSIWQLAKAYAAVNDSGYHQLISHWLNTHAVIEPVIIATHRQLSVTHPIHKLMTPHYRDTMNINALARQTLINAGGIFESTVFPQKYALTMSSDVYKSWKLTEQGLPDELLKRGVAVEDPSSPHKLRLLIKDYPYAVDGLAIWSAIGSWVNDYCSLYYPNDSTVRSDTELQAWWNEIRLVGHGDKKDEDWWPKMQTVKELTKTCATLIWIASALHAAVNFGQYPYAGYLPNRPTVSRRPMPEPGTEAYEKLKKNPDKVFLETITSQLQTILGISLIEILSRHSSDEVYLGQRDTPEWTSDEKALDAFDRFSERLIGIEKKIEKLNADPNMKNRNGPVKFPYTLLHPNTSDKSGIGGLVPKGIPNSVSI
ncbi:Lipoxygenase [Rhynchospora pubera]|uniref:Lipoxygenase n=1 Tax=Rhynchospora pubera TaxID=906938 RepID=A0AAV8HF06_9POAL|nr:Lipoxygenase [Rhynchospora pubera]